MAGCGMNWITELPDDVFALVLLLSGFALALALAYPLEPWYMRRRPPKARYIKRK